MTEGGVPTRPATASGTLPPLSSLPVQYQPFAVARREIFTGVVLPGSLPQIFTGIRLAWGISLIVVIAAEMVGAIVSIGYMLEAQQTFRTDRVSAGIIVIGLIGFLTDLGFRRLRRLLLPWHGDTAR
jgi:ABC-type nitrate/sulfonate/bicarbonate transport system permease component